MLQRFSESRPTSGSDGINKTKGSAASLTLWAVSSLGLLLVIAGAVTIGQDGLSPKLNSPGHAVTAQQLSSTFRDVAKATFPGVVSIETRGKVVQGRDMQELFEGDPRFEQFFRNSPEMERFFEQRRNTPRQAPRGQGSGFIIDREGYIVTNNHVVDNAAEVTVRLYDGREYDAEVVGVDPRSDVAVIKIDAPDLEPIPMGESDDVEVGDFVLAFGNPFGLEMTMTQGIISAKGRGPGINEREDYLQTDAAINPGNSGGPLVSLNGEVIGINTAISSRSGGYDGVGFAIPIQMARWAVDQIIETGRVQRAYIGVVIQPITNDLAGQLGVDINTGAIVTQVMPESPADEAGLEPGDVIRELDGKSVRGTRELQGIVERLEIEKSYPLLIQRDGKKKRLTIAMAEMPDNLTASRSEEAAPEEDSEAVTENQLGVQVQNLDEDLAEQLGYSKDVKGVVVTSVEAGSVGQANGLQEGEVIEKVGQTRVNNVAQFKQAMEDADLDKGVLMLVRRGTLTRFIVVKAD